MPGRFRAPLSITTDERILRVPRGEPGEASLLAYPGPQTHNITLNSFDPGRRSDEETQRTPEALTVASIPCSVGLVSLRTHTVHTHTHTAQHSQRRRQAREACKEVTSGEKGPCAPGTISWPKSPVTTPLAVCVSTGKGQQRAGDRSPPCMTEKIGVVSGMPDRAIDTASRYWTEER